jgi:formylglycine-generating enzyme required for sulfatase activity
MADATPIVGGLLAAEEDETCTRLLLAGRCVAEALRVEEATRKEVTRRLEDKFATCTGALVLNTGQVLAEIAGEDSVDFFLRLAHDDARRREAALWSLGQMGRQPDEALRERVLERLLACFQGKELRQEAGAALVEVWGVETAAAELFRRQVFPSSEQTMAALAEAMDLAMVTIPAGEFRMGDEERKVFVDAFRIGRYPVTNAQYKRFVDAIGHEPPRHWQGRTYPPENATHPAVFVTWDDAVAYARWAGKRLPTEEEWEKAARGTDGREYPWGDWEEGRCNTSEAGIRDTTPVGHYSPGGDSPYGCADMAGNVWEWTASAWESGSERRVVRGGSWIFDQGYARCAYRSWHIPINFSLSVGLRVVVSLALPSSEC